MTQIYEYNINKELQDLLVNYNHRVVRMSLDLLVLTIGRVQIENLDWRWEPEWSKDINAYLEWDPWDCKSVPPFNKFRGSFKVSKYGLSYRKIPLTVASYKPLWEPGTKPNEQARIMWIEMEKMKKDGSRKCENGIEVVPGSLLWNTVDTLATVTRNSFRTLLNEKVKNLESKRVSYDGEKLLDAGVQITPEVLGGLRNLKFCLDKHPER